MGKNEKPDSTDKEIIKKIEESAPEVEIGREPEPEKEKEKPEPGPSGPDTDKKPVPEKEMVRDFTTGLVKTLDVVQTGICLTISKRERTESNKSYYKFDKDDSQALQDVWYPIVLKWYLKIPMELVAIGVTATILTANFTKAKADAIENKK